jgi:putative membrane protein
MMYWNGDGAGWGLAMMLFAMVFLALLVVGVVLLVRPSWGGRERPSTPRKSRALDLLDERFARGEIDSEEYEQRRRVLTGEG